MTRTASPQTIRKLAAVAMRESSLRSYPAPPVQTPALAAQAVQMADLSHVARHMLRFMARHRLVSAQMLRHEIGQESDVTPAISALIRHQLIEPVRLSYRVTQAGMGSLGTAPGHALPQKAAPRTVIGLGAYQGAELQYRPAATH